MDEPMKMMLSPQVTVAMSQKLKLVGGCTQTIFPEVEVWLKTQSDRRRALEYVAARKNMNRYRSVIDFLFCEIFVEWRRACFRYYQGSGPQLRFEISEELREIYVRVLLMALQRAYDDFCGSRRRSWTAFRARLLASTNSPSWVSSR